MEFQFPDNSIKLVRASLIDQNTGKEYQLETKVERISRKPSRCLFIEELDINQYKLQIKLDFNDKTLSKNPTLDITIFKRDSRNKVIKQIKNSEWHNTAKNSENTYKCILKEDTVGISIEFNFVFTSTKEVEITSQAWIKNKITITRVI